MSMTENEAIEYLKHMVCCLLGESSVDDADFEHIQEKYADREIIKAYRIIAETFDDFKAYKNATEEFVQKQFWEAMEICKAYRAIGTVEEFKELKEKSEPKKPIHYGLRENKVICPHCNEWLEAHSSKVFCCWCGGKIDWSE